MWRVPEAYKVLIHLKSPMSGGKVPTIEALDIDLSPSHVGQNIAKL